MATFEVTDHALLSADAQDLEVPVFDAHNDAAEIMLGLAGIDAAELTQSQVAMATLAVVYQVNYQIARAEEGFVLESVTKGPLTRKFRKEHISPEAAPLAATVVSAITPSPKGYDPADWATVTNLS